MKLSINCFLNKENIYRKCKIEKGLCYRVKYLKNRLILILVFNCTIMLTGFNKFEENEITALVKSMISTVNKKDAEGYIQTLDEYFIKTTYGNKDFIRKNINEFGHLDLLEFDVETIHTYVSYAHYKLIHTGKDNIKTAFFGKMILVKTKEGWRIYHISEEEI
ncbi:hypothetical protein E2K98_24755 [Bacillus salipaludis]|uniref:Nuclear transport factor 2 family protein n=1 Tax=Bacillus salipaludis TaxID=2547811 RepID=A0A4R5VK50_9BACI|nr:hypothetical protein [Bacillus salipaludis]TDK58130.1 hypothetical protein E2K98_24755 [Bacillus salipaludis]